MCYEKNILGWLGNKSERRRLVLLHIGAGTVQDWIRFGVAFSFCFLLWSGISIAKARRGVSLGGPLVWLGIAGFVHGFLHVFGSRAGG